jgi:predicted nucleic acid-binding protein
VTAIVVDASVSACWMLDDEYDVGASAVLAQLATSAGIVPLLWQHEMRNILLVARRRGRLSASAMAERVASLAELPLAIDGKADLGVALMLAERHALSFYDSLYLELAMRCGATLATLDRALVRAARAEQVPALVEP